MVCTDFQVAEAALVRDVLYACQGVDGKYVHFNSASCGRLGAYELNSSAGVSAVQRSLVLRLCELGWLFRKVREAISNVHEPGTGGTVRQAWCAALDAELREFYKLLAVLQAQTGHPAPQQNEQGEDGVYLTLRRLAVWLAEPLARFRWLAALADSCAQLLGGALVAALHARAQHGDPFVRGLLLRSLRQTCRPLFQAISAWVFEGRLDSAPGEFFVVKAANPSGDMWRGGFQLDHAMRPSFIGMPLALNILRAGKSINFLRQCCGDTEWADDETRQALLAATAQLTYGQEDALERAVSDAAARIDAHVLGLLRGRYGLAAHCSALKRYLLHGQGDFIQSLMDQVEHELSSRAAHVSEYALNASLDAAQRASLAQYDDPDILARLHVKLDRALSNETGWDVFTLRYEVHEPLASVLTADALGAYLRVFKLLWALKRVEHSLAGSWQLLNSMQRQLAGLRNLERRLGSSCPGLEAVWGELRQSHSIRHKMAHFCASLQYYIMLEVLEVAWRNFQQRAAAAADLDELIAAHSQFLDALLQKALLDEGSAGVGHGSLQATLRSLFRTMLDLLPPIRRLHEAVNGAVTELRTQVGQRAKKQESTRLVGVSEAMVKDIRTALSQLGAEYNRQHMQLLQLLPAHVQLLPADSA